MRSLKSSVRAPRTLLVSAVAAALVLGGAAAPSTAAPAAGGSAAGLRIVPGDRTLTAAWSAVPGAAGYTVRIGTTRDLRKARTVVTRDRSVRLRGLKNGRPYFVGVLPDFVGVLPGTARTAALAAAQRVVRATATAGVPFPVATVTAEAGPLANQVTVRWTGGGRATKVAVVAGSNVVTDQRSFHSGWYPATTRSITVTVPASLRSALGAGSGNPVFVKVVQSNSGSTAFGASYSYDRKYRPSPVGTWAFAKAEVPPAEVTRLKVAELNVQSVGATSRYSEDNRWAARVGRVAAYVNDPRADPDLLMTAELATNLTAPCTNSERFDPYRCSSRTQVADLGRRLGRLKPAGADAYARVMDQMRGFGGRWAGNTTAGAHVFYDPAKMTLLDHGYFSPALEPAQSFKNVTGLGVSNWTGRNAIGGDRWVSWAKFRTAVGGRVFYAVAAHLPVGSADVVVSARREEAQKLAAAIDRLAGGLPVVLGADLNADSVRNPRAGHTVFMENGWFDAAAVAQKGLRTGMKVSTANGSGPQDGADPGYGTRPVLHPYETSRIDYILLKNSPYTFRYANVLRLNANGTFLRSQQGTDHNMQLATIGIAGPAS